MRTGAARRPRVQAAEAPTRGGHCQLATAATLMRLLARIISSYTYPSLCICAFTPAWESMDSEADGCAASRHQLSRSAGAGEAELSAIGTRDSAHTSSRRPATGDPKRPVDARGYGVRTGVLPHLQQLCDMRRTVSARLASAAGEARAAADGWRVRRHGAAWPAAVPQPPRFWQRDVSQARACVRPWMCAHTFRVVYCLCKSRGT